MASYAFLSPEWIDEARAVRERHAGEHRVQTALKMNLTIEDVPHGSGSIAAHVDTTGGEVDIELGHLDGPDVTVTLDFPTAKAVLVDNDAEAAMAAFMAGKVRVEGDMTKLLAYQSEPITPVQRALSEELRAITA